MIDFHCHLDLYPDPFEIADRCRAKKLYVLSVTTTPSAWPQSRRLSVDGDRIRIALGLHPQIAHERASELEMFDELLSQTKYVGEIGLDGGPEHQGHQRQQVQAFEHILRSCSKAGGRIMSIHSRRAAASVIEKLAVHPDAGIAILHWFSGSAQELDKAVAENFWFSLGPTMLSSKKGRLLATRMPRNRILTETDGPFAQFSGSPLLPWEVDGAEVMLSGLWAIPVEEVRATLYENLRVLTTTFE